MIGASTDQLWERAVAVRLGSCARRLIARLAIPPPPGPFLGRLARTLLGSRCPSADDGRRNTVRSLHVRDGGNISCGTIKRSTPRVERMRDALAHRGMTALGFGPLPAFP